TTYVSGGKAVTVNLADSGSGLKASQPIYYAWSTSNATVPSSWSSVTSTNAAGAKSATVTVPATSSSSLTGTYYLWIKAGTLSDVSGNTSNQVVSALFKFDNTNPSLSVSTSKTTKSITAVATASATSGISKYEFSKDNGATWVANGTSNTYTFTGLTHKTAYNIKVRVTSGVGRQTSSATAATTTNTISSPTFSINKTGFSSEKELTIYYNNSGADFKYYFSYDGTTWKDATQIQYITFKTEGTVIAKVTDGTNTVNASYSVLQIDDALVGQIDLWPSSAIPSGYLLCNGQAVSRTTYANLFKTIGTAYGAGDGSTTFNLPNMAGKNAIGSNGTYLLGKSGGSTTSKITTLPSHTHSIPEISGMAASAGAHQHYVDPVNTDSYIVTMAKNSNNVSNRWSDYPENNGFSMQQMGNWYYNWGKGDTNLLASGGAHTHSVTTVASTTGSTGSGSTFSVQNPFITVNYIIKY
ncbi:MAG: phage tail protein, partial [Oscillospiraceae bacterium]